MSAIKEQFNILISNAIHIHPELRKLYAASILYKRCNKDYVNKIVGPIWYFGGLREVNMSNSMRKIEICEEMLMDISEDDYRRLSDEYTNIEKKLEVL